MLSMPASPLIILSPARRATVAAGVAARGSGTRRRAVVAGVVRRHLHGHRVAGGDGHDRLQVLAEVAPVDRLGVERERREGRRGGGRRRVVVAGAAAAPAAGGDARGQRDAGEEEGQGERFPGQGRVRGCLLCRHRRGRADFGVGLEDGGLHWCPAVVLCLARERRPRWLWLPEVGSGDCGAAVGWFLLPARVLIASFWLPEFWRAAFSFFAGPHQRGEGGSTCRPAGPEVSQAPRPARDATSLPGGRRQLASAAGRAPRVCRG